MKRVFIFISLKTAKIAGILFIPYFLGISVSKWPWYMKNMTFEATGYWFMGIVTICILFFAFTTVIFILSIIYTNWKWSKKIANRS